MPARPLPGAPNGEAPAAGIPGRLIAAVSFGTVLQPLNSSMIAVALVGIRTEFAGGAAVNWLVSGLYLATAVAAPTMGRLADVVGARRVFLIGLSLILAGSLLAPFSPNLGVLIACRVLLGLGTGAQYPCAIAMVRHASQDVRSRPESALAALSLAAQLTVALGPTLGGVLVGLFGWSGIFWVNLPMVAVAAVAVLRTVPPDRPASELAARYARQSDPDAGVASSIDPAGLVLFAAAMSGLMFFLLSVADSPQWWWLAVVLPAAGGLIWWEGRASTPFLDLRLLRNRALSVTYLRVVFTYAAFYMIFYGIPQWLEEAARRTPAEAGLIVLPIAVVGAGSTVLAARLQRRGGVFPTLLTGTAALVLGGILLMLPRHDTALPLLLGVCALLGLPNGFNNMANQSAMYQAVPESQIGAASGLYRTCQYVGANLAAALIAVLLGASADDPGLHRLGLAIAIISGGLLLAALAGRPGRAPGVVSRY